MASCGLSLLLPFGFDFDFNCHFDSERLAGCAEWGYGELRVGLALAF